MISLEAMAEIEKGATPSVIADEFSAEIYCDKAHKDLIGSFYHPQNAVSDTKFMQHLASGFLGQLLGLGSLKHRIRRS